MLSSDGRSGIASIRAPRSSSKSPEKPKCYSFRLVSIVPINPSQADESTDVANESRAHQRRTVVAALLSALAPGTGQLLLGQRRKGTILLALLAALLVCFWLRLPGFFFAFVMLCWGCIGLYFYAACSAIWSSHLPGSRRPSRSWLAVIVPLAAATLWLGGDAVIVHLAGLRLFNIPVSSMEPTIRQGDRIIADMKYYQSRDPKIHDTVILKKDDVWLIKRMIAAGVVGKGGFIYVNGPMLSENPTCNTMATRRSG